MCLPMAAMALAASIGSTALSAYGAYQQSAAQKSAYQAQAAAADRERAAAGERADQEARRIGAQVANTRGQQAAALAANGVDASFGSSAGVLATTDYYGMEDLQTSAKNAQDTDYAYRDRAAQARSAAAQTNPGLAAATSLLGGAGKVASSWYNFAGKGK